MDAYGEASKALFEVFNDTSPFVEGLSIDEAFLDVGGLRRISGTPAEIAARLRREVRERVGLPVSVGVARTKFLAKVASGVAKPDGLLVVPTDGELDFLHPLPSRRCGVSGRSPRAKLRDRGVTTVGQVARLGEATLVADARPGVRPPHPCPRPQPRSRGLSRWAAVVVRSGSQRALGRRPRSPASIDADARRLSSTGSHAGCERPTGCAAPSCSGCGSTTSRAPRGRTRCREATAHTETILARCEGLVAAAMPMIERQGITLIGVTFTNLVDDGAVQLALPFDRVPASAIDTTLDEVRDRFGSAAVTRAVLLGRHHGPSVPLLPD